VSQHSFKSFSAALFEKSFYLAFANIFIFFKSPLKVLFCYVFEIGNYPQRFFVRTPLGLQGVEIFSHSDLITLVECFGKLDYIAPRDISVVVDFGSNIGISALYFLTRNKDIKVYLFEPVPKNILRLKENLKGFENRYILNECAVGIERGQFDFACDETGRYGGLIKGGALHFSQSDQNIISVNVIPANQILEEILCEHEFLDILKIDVEGYENQILSHLSLGIISCVDRIYAETTDYLRLQGFAAKRYGGLTRYFRKKIMR
jgi:FkbM family methyltransferase